MLKKQEYWHAKREKEMAGGGRKKQAQRMLVWEIAKFDKFVKSFTVSFLCGAEHEEAEWDWNSLSSSPVFPSGLVFQWHFQILGEMYCVYE